jgi:hypothetical protein
MRLHIHLRKTDPGVKEIERLMELDPDLKRSKLIREAVGAYRDEYQKRIKYLEEKERQSR